MISKLRTSLLGVCAAALIGAHSAQAANIKLEPFVTGVNSPLVMTQPKGDDRMFVAQQDGRIKIVKNGKITGTFLDIRHLITDILHDFDERGLLGLAFHPDYASNGKFYVAYSGHLNYQDDLAKMLWYSHSNVVAEFTVSAEDEDVADPNSMRIITSIAWPQFNHNGHWIGFGPDGMLYISTGDGGYANDWGIGHNPEIGNGQDLATNMGKILRVDVDGDYPYAIPADNPFVKDNNANDEIWAYGLRNPWRCSFDMGGNNELFCADVQQNSYEEVDIITKGSNLGWRVMEANHCFDFLKPNEHPKSCDNAGMTAPIIEYNHCSAKPDGCLGTSITGGYVYRGAHKAWDGKYIFGDWSKSFATMDGQILIGSNNGGKWSLDVAKVTNMDGKIPYILAFAQGNDGEVYALTSVTTGPNGHLDTIYKIVPAN